jgi:response regulator of citrate/malate metabolism
LALDLTGKVEVARTLDHYPTALELVRSLRALATEIVFISFESLEKGLEIVKILEAEGSQVQIVGFQRELDAGVLRESMRAGVREFMTEPFELRLVLETLASIKTCSTGGRPLMNRPTRFFRSCPPKPVWALRRSR